MCNFDNLSDDEKQAAHESLMACVNAFGGKNFFLQLLEAIRKTKPHPLMNKSCGFRFELGTISWEKVIFADKLELLMRVRKTESKTGNLLPKQTEKSYKKVLNLVRTLKPIKFTVKPLDENLGNGFETTPFTLIDEHTTRLDPIFDALFFCSIETIKKVLNHKA